MRLIVEVNRSSLRSGGKGKKIRERKKGKGGNVEELSKRIKE